MINANIKHKNKNVLAKNTNICPDTNPPPPAPVRPPVSVTDWPRHS